MKDNMIPAPTTFGDLLRALRTARGIGLVALAHSAGVDPALLSRIETGKRKPSTTGMIERIMGPLGIAKDSEEHKALYNLAGLMTKDELWQAVVEASAAQAPQQRTSHPPKDRSDLLCTSLADLVGQATVWAVGHGATAITVRSADERVQRFQVLAPQKSAANRRKRK